MPSRKTLDERPNVNRVFDPPLCMLAVTKAYEHLRLTMLKKDWSDSEVLLLCRELGQAANAFADRLQTRLGQKGTDISLPAEPPAERLSLYIPNRKEQKSDRK